VTALAAVMSVTASARELSGTETWTTAESPYTLTEDHWVPEASRLIIQSGVEVRFGPGVQLIVDGQLNVEGTSEAPVLFIGSDGRWGGIVINGRGYYDFSTISGAVITGADTGLLLNGSATDVIDSTFDANVVGLRLRDPQADVTVLGSVFENNETAITGYTRNIVNLHGNDLWNNETTLLAKPAPMYDCGPDAGLWDVHENDILRGPANGEFHSNDVRTPPGSASSDYRVVASYNWWGTADEEEVYGRMTTAMNCCPGPSLKEIVWRPVATSPQTAYQPTGDDPNPEPMGTLHGDPGVVTAVTSPEHGSCREPEAFRSLRGTAYPAMGGPSKITVALRRGTSANCRWWSHERHRFVPGGCDKQKWFRAKVDDSRSPWQWRYRFPSPLPKGKYMAWSYGFAEPTQLGQNQVAFRLR